MSRRLGAVAIVVFAFGALGGTALANLGLLALLIATLLAPASLLDWGHRCRVTALLAATFSLLVVVATAHAMLTTPTPWALQRDGTVDLLLLMLFPLVAIWTAGDECRILWALGLGLAGLFVGRLMELDAASWQALMQGGRIGIELAAACGLAVDNGIVVD
ncbi:MAG: hypothetical protein L0H63_11700, partial [Nitrococcus sp.]|nr:hypothetical protein [Nitrococcus sp.]